VPEGDDRSDDRFADLRAGDKLADLDRQEPEPEAPPPRRRGRYTWVVGVAAVIAIAVVALNSLPNPARGSDGPEVGEPIPRFAAPDARVAEQLEPDIDPNINQSASDPAEGETPACEVPGESVVRSCDYTGKPLVITFIAPTSECEAFLDRIDGLSQRFKGVNFIAVLSAADAEKGTEVLAEHDWRQPVALDRNGAILTLYRVSFCPTLVFARKGGIARATTTEQLTEAELVREIKRTQR
jgi:hypothetical protein